MEHEVYVPFPVGTVRQALTEPERVARCVPGVQLDADAAPEIPEGRLRLRIGSSTITYRGTLMVTDAGAEGGSGDGAADAADGAVTVEARGSEARGDGSVALTLTVRLSPATDPGPGTTLACTGTVSGDGRFADVSAQSAETAGRRLLDRFAANLAVDLEKRPVARPDAGEEAAEGRAEPSGHGVFDTEVPPPSLDPFSDMDEAADASEAVEAGDLAEVGDTDDAYDYRYEDEPASAAPAEAAHARRTMIGRSAEEVDHAPPRGRYAPVPAPETSGTSAALRWAAPAAAVVLASAVVVGRVLRRRR
ncbi:carbon monoxide dehydrogenase subunit G [Streptomyces piniterrae]|uniref:Carbon monoxide dehydrogenase subunit G n=1 Tax=Streptomyces piniterrae TaxID=2571125 RepID=A0A4U0MYH0_9ACTN|nr:carbon monoxide dehydrogenase subunit G [Streptomyces piniterrae]TJZ42254.1 carbon monoxide dehydrogenase subunit G [Streptomyces piniterrae]